jgi:hypothetical protein
MSRDQKEKVLNACKTTSPPEKLKGELSMHFFMEHGLRSRQATVSAVTDLGIGELEAEFGGRLKECISTARF